MDAFDWLVFVGILFIGVAVWLVLGWPGLAGYAGAACVVIGLAGARRGRNGAVR